MANLPGYAELCLAANRRYLQALAFVDVRGQALDDLAQLTQPVRNSGTVHRGLNPISPQDAVLFAAVLRGEYFIMSFRDRDIRLQLYGHHPDPETRRRQSTAVSRQFRLLHAHRLIAKIRRSHKWRITECAARLLSATRQLRHRAYPEAHTKCAA